MPNAVLRALPLLLMGGCVLIVGPPIGDTGTDTGTDTDTGTPTCPDGTVTFTPAGGAAADISSLFAAGTAAAPVAYTIATPGTLAFCGGTFHASLTVSAEEAVITGVGSGLTVLSGGGVARIVHHQGAEAITLSDLTLTLGSAVDGGAVLADTGEIEVSGCVFLENSATNRGGALVALTGEIEALDSTFDDNEAPSFGGAIWVGGELTLTDVVFDGNESTGSPGVGGAVFSEGGAVAITRGTFTDNEATNLGGGVYASGGTLAIVGSTFTGNASVSVSGGALAATGATVTLTDTVFEDNVAFDEGGAADFAGCTVTCTRVAPSRGGFYGNTPGVFFLDLGGHVLTSDGCDWGEGADDNTTYDLAVANTGGGVTNHTFGDDESFACDAASCTPAR